MQVTQDVTLQIEPALSAEVAAKNDLLISSVGLTTSEAIWELNGLPGRPSLILRLRDQDGKLTSSGTFALNVFKNETELTARLSDLNHAMYKVAEWRKAVRVLFERIRPWCETLTGGSYVKEKTSWVEEEQSGFYEVSELIVIRGERGMFITPVGAWVLGADGRVDMVGPGDRAVLEYAASKDSWFHIPNDAPYRELAFNESLFRELAEACLDD